MAPSKKKSASVNATDEVTTALVPTKKAATPPRKNKLAPTPRKSKPSTDPFITVTRFTSPLSLEMYTYNKGENDGYMNGFLVSINGKRKDGTSVPVAQTIQDGNFHSCPYRRKPNTNNEHELNTNGYWKMVIIRYPKEGVSTPETRQEGLLLLSTFFKDPAHSEYPPSSIRLVDDTDERNLPALDEYFMDEQIKELLLEDFDPAVLNQSFFTTFNDFALKCWKYPFISSFALSLGFPKI